MFATYRVSLNTVVFDFNFRCAMVEAGDQDRSDFLIYISVALSLFAIWIISKLIQSSEKEESDGK